MGIARHLPLRFGIGMRICQGVHKVGDVEWRLVSGKLQENFGNPSGKLQESVRTARETLQENFRNVSGKRS